MTTRLIFQKNIATQAAERVTTSTNTAPTIPAAVLKVPNSKNKDVTTAEAAKATTTTTLLTQNDIKSEVISIEQLSSPPCTEKVKFLYDHEVVATQMRGITQEKMRSNCNEPSVIGVLVPMDAADSIEEANSSSMTSLSAIKNKVDISQQIVDGQVTVVHAADTEQATPQYITVTVSAQDAGQNYQVQYVDTELYHSNSSQSQMTYPFCPVGEYQTNGQSYYSPAASGNYTSATATNSSTTHATVLPYIVPVDESLLLNTSCQSHSRDSPHSLTEVAYIQEAQSTPQTPTSTTTNNSASGASIDTGGSGASPESEKSPLNANKIGSATVKWLSRNYETADGVSLPRSTLYNHYMQHCNKTKLEPVNAASFGKLIRSVFSGLRTRRLGTRGNSKYHYYGIRIKPGSTLNQSMDDKSPTNYHSTTTAGTNNTSAGNVSSTNFTNSNNKAVKKHGIKAETYETCVQYLGDGANAIPSLPNIELDHTFHSELTADDIETFRVMYREHCESFLDAVLNLEFNTIEFLWRDFWRVSDNNNLDECEEEKYLSKTKLFLLCHCSEVQKFVREVDYQFYQNMVDVIIPDVLRSIPNALTQAIRNFAKNLEIWLCESIAGIPEHMMQIKSSAVSAFCQTLRRYTSLNHLAQAARAVLQNSSQISQMLNDLNRVDFHNVQEQAAWVCQCETSVVQSLENDFKTALQQQSSLEQWASWLQLVVDSALEEHRGKPNYDKVARQFLLKWSFYSSMIIRDLTLRSASSFGSFHLIRLLYDEYMFYLVEHKIAEAQQKTAIAVICDRMRNSMELAFDYQLEFIDTSSESDIAAKRMKHE